MEDTQRKTRVYIAGKVSGEDKMERWLKFGAAETALQAMGYTTVNPLRICASNWPWRKCMTTCIKALTGCDAIYMLKDWRKSKGARLEHFIAMKLNYRIMLQEQPRRKGKPKTDIDD